MAPRPSQVQLRALVEFLERNPGVAKGLFRTSSGKAQTKKLWRDIAPTLNSLGIVKKDGFGWCKYWCEKKSTLKKNWARNNLALKTGGDPTDTVLLTAMDERMVMLLGEQVGDPAAAVKTSASHPECVYIPTGESAPASPNVPTSPESVADLDMTERIPIKEEETDANVKPRSTTDRPVRNLRARSPIRQSLPSRYRRPLGRGYPATAVDRLSIEAQRVEAKLITARALDRMARALESMAQSIGGVTTAFTNLVNVLQPME